jgi:hypothetical protein
MGNPAIPPQPGYEPLPWPPVPNEHNGIYGQILGQFVPKADDHLPKPGPEQQNEPKRYVISEVPNLGPVRFTFELYSYKHRKNTFWSWRVVWAEQVKQG